MSETNTNTKPTTNGSSRAESRKAVTPSGVEVPHVYKQTTVGMIPEEWNVFEFGNISKRAKEKYVPNFDEYFKCLELEHFDQSTGKINGWINSSEQKSTKNVFSKNDVLFGKLRPYLRKYWLAEFNGVCSSEIWVLQPINGCSNNYLFYLVQSDRFIQIANVASGSKMPRADWDYVSTFPFCIPPLPEQQKIAKILSTWDNAIDSCKKIIKKLKKRNKGLAQQLLTGKTRVDGFEGTEWTQLKANKIFKSHTDKSHNGNLEILSATQERGVIPRSMNNIDIKYDENSLGTYKKVEVGDFVISLRSFQGGIEYSEYQGIVSPAYTILKEILPISKDFYKVYFKTETFINRLNTIIYGIRDGKQIGFTDFSTLNLPYPSIEEQEAITEILNTANKELKQYEQKLINLQLQKKGLMQQLLTGKVRVKLN